jgi:ATP-dependent Clp protease adapter protein ClpS
MTTTKVDKTQETRTGERTRTEAPWYVIMHDDFQNPINRVGWRLRRTIPGMTIKRATKVT